MTFILKVFIEVDHWNIVNSERYKAIQWWKTCQS